MNYSSYDLVLIINQHVCPSSIIEMVNNLDGPCLVITSHELLPNELDELRSIIGVNMDIFSFADLLDDPTQAYCDQQATAALLPCIDQPQMRAKYTQLFMMLSMRLKNEALFHRIESRIENATLKHCTGLGIHDAFWCLVGSTPITVERPVDPPQKVRLSQLHTITDGVKSIVFLSPIDRLNFINEARVESLPMPQNLSKQAQINPQATRQTIASLASKRLPSKWRLATTVHGYSPWMAAIEPAIDIYIDGYHPPNYTRSYLDYYEPDAVFCGNDPLSRRWFSEFGRKISLAPLVCSAQMSEPVTVISSQPCILVALNHAGDWSALINRGDTDRLVNASAVLARAMPEVDVVIRTHPTMAVEAHEGATSRDRLRLFVEGCRLKNLIISDSTLAQDFARGDIFISEYSQVLIDAWRRGKIGLIANLSGRRSYMEEYEALGFPVINSISEMIGQINFMIKNTSAAAMRQRVAVVRYNHLADGSQL